jgi:hypothetical protein
MGARRLAAGEELSSRGAAIYILRLHCSSCRIATERASTQITLPFLGQVHAAIVAAGFIFKYFSVCIQSTPNMSGNSYSNGVCVHILQIQIKVLHAKLAYAYSTFYYNFE